MICYLMNRMKKISGKIPWHWNYNNFMAIRLLSTKVADGPLADVPLDSV
jgi:hypothetical protein